MNKEDECSALLLSVGLGGRLTIGRKVNMKRPTAGKKAFYAMGQRDKANGLKAPRHIRDLPIGHWARMAYQDGWNGW
jgi:hypothetical protein